MGRQSTCPCPRQSQATSLGGGGGSCTVSWRFSLVLARIPNEYVKARGLNMRARRFCVQLFLSLNRRSLNVQGPTRCHFQVMKLIVPRRRGDLLISKRGWPVLSERLRDAGAGERKKSWRTPSPRSKGSSVVNQSTVNLRRNRAQIIRHFAINQLSSYSAVSFSMACSNFNHCPAIDLEHSS
jgi:hypothetical protein